MSEITETCCWKCNWHYPITLNSCPNCKSANANIDLNAAFAQVDHVTTGDINEHRCSD